MSEDRGTNLGNADDSDRDRPAEAKAIEDDLQTSLELSVRSEDGPTMEEVTDRFVVKYPAYAARLRQVMNERRSQGGVGSASEIESPPGGTSSDRRSPRISSRRSLRVPPIDLPTGSPTRIGRYPLVRELGRGGMGVVYLGVDEKLKRLVAIKVLPAELSQDAELLERFEREQVAILHLEHSGIIPLYEVGRDDGLHYYVMRYLDGVALDAFLESMWNRRILAEEAETKVDKKRSAERPSAASRRSPVDPDGESMVRLEGNRDILHVIEKTARALDYAHQRGVTHRDVKPSNIIIDRDGNPNLLDFGLAKLAQEATITKTGHLMGTIPYMSPEQVATRRIAIDHRTDVYSLGVTLYECVAGRRPFTREPAEALMFDILMRDPPPPRRIRPDISPDIETVVLKCLEKNPQHRFQRCHDLAEELARIRAHKQIESEPVGMVGRAWRWLSRHRSVAGLIALTAFASILLLAFIAYGDYQANQELEDATEHELELARNARAEISGTKVDIAAPGIRAVDTGHRRTPTERASPSPPHRRRADTIAGSRRPPARNRRLSLPPFVGDGGLHGREG